MLSPFRPLITWSCQGQDMPGTSHPCGPTMNAHQDCTATITRKNSTDQGHTSMTTTTKIAMAMTTIAATITTIATTMTTIAATMTTMAATMTTITAMTCPCLTSIPITSTMTMPTVVVLMFLEGGSITTGLVILLTAGITGPLVL